MIGLQYNKRSAFVDMIEGITAYSGFRVVYQDSVRTIEGMIEHIGSNGILREPVSFAASPELYPKFKDISVLIEREIGKRNQRRV